MPLSSSVLISRDEVLGLLDEAVASLPDELKRARWMLADLDALTEQRRREADALLDEVRAEAARLVSRTEISRQAKVHAERLVADAEERGRAILHEAEDFCDQRLAQMEIVLDRLPKDRPVRPRPAPAPHRARGRRGRRRRGRRGRVLRPGHRLAAGGPSHEPLRRPRLEAPPPRRRDRGGRLRRALRPRRLARGRRAGRRRGGPRRRRRGPPRAPLVPRRRRRRPARSSRRGARSCRRCATSVHGVLDVRVAERFRRGAEPDDEDAYPLDDEQVDLFDLVRDAVVLELPLAPAVPPGLRRAVRRRAGRTATRTRAGASRRPTRGGLHSMRSACRTRPRPAGTPAPTHEAPWPSQSERHRRRSRGRAAPRTGGSTARRAASARTAPGPRRRTWSARTAGGTRVASRSRSIELTPGAQLPVALDAMGGDRAPADIVAGARAAVDELGIDVVLVGPPDLVGDTLGPRARRVHRGDLDGRRPARSRCGARRTPRIVRAAELVRDGEASATVSAGNTGAVMAAALLRLGTDQGRRAALHRDADPAAGLDARHPVRRRRERRVHARDARAVRPDGQRARDEPLRGRRPARRAPLDRRGADQGHAARQGGPRAPERTPRAASSSTATSRAGTSSARPSTSSSRTASPGTSR